jgi:branched-chain amino acid transport system ATP-binding protein
MREAGPPAVLSTTNLGLRIRGVTIVDGVNLDVNEGELLVIIGPNGAGKTTLFNLLSGVTRPTSGTVTFRGEDITTRRRTFGHGAGWAARFRPRPSSPSSRTLENVRLAAQAYLGGSDRVWELADRQPRRSNARAARSRRSASSSASATRAGSLSHGEKRKLDLAILLCGDPQRGAARRADGRDRGRRRAGDDGADPHASTAIAARPC